MPIGRGLISFATCLTVAAGLAPAQATRPAPQAASRVQYAPDRDYDLIHVAVDLTLDYQQREFHGVVTHTLAPLRDELKTIKLDCGQNLKIESCEIDGKKSSFSQIGELLIITPAQAIPSEKAAAVLVRYSGGQEVRGQRGFHWVTPTPAEPTRVGFWTLGEPRLNHQWLPIWDYPNDFTTSEMRVTVPAAWSVFSNGELKSDVPNADSKTRTFQWKIDQPHATYLLSVIAAPFDIQRSSWRGVPLMYAVPKGKRSLIDDTFGETPEILSFYSDTTGVKYAWPKYSQAITYDFPGGMENVSATTINVGTLADRRNGLDSSAAGVAHEMAHQWFGDLVTCSNWGDIWLNEGFATFFQKLYFEHSRGRAAYDHEVQGLFDGSFSATRALATRTYADPMAMFDNAGYAKGAAVLHCLRRTLGDKAFFAGIHHYLVKYRHQPVDSHDFCTAMTEETGINLERFFDQWVYKPGHPVINYAWKWDDAGKQVLLTIAQTQNTSDGTPIYDMNMEVGLITEAEFRVERIRVDLASQELRIQSDRKPDTVLLDPNHDFPMAVPHLNWAETELPFILRYAPNAVDRERAMARMLQGSPSDADIRLIADAVQADTAGVPVFQSIAGLGKLHREDLRLLFRGQINHADLNRRAEAILALGGLSKSQTDVAVLRNLVNDQQPYAVVRASLITLGKWDPSGNRDVFEKATTMQSPFQRIRLAACDALQQADIAEGKQPIDPEPKMTKLVRETLSAWANGNTANPRGDPTLRTWLKNLKSLSLTMKDDVRDQHLVRRGSPIAYVYYYKLITGSEAWYIGFYVTPEGEIVNHVRFRVELDR
jgi:aminopeptidase N